MHPHCPRLRFPKNQPGAGVLRRIHDKVVNVKSDWVAPFDVHPDTHDAIILARMKHEGVTTIISFDTDFDRFPDVTRKEPEPLEKQAA